MPGPSEQPSDGKDYAEGEAEAANRQNAQAEHAIEDSGFGEPGGEAAHSAGGTGPTGEPHAESHPENTKTGGGGADRDSGVESGMLGEGV